ncbi:MAG: RNA polymerase sigma factor RpoD/SigA, partial [Candidatus Omnitrophica bacterium]|nr:RNA polymerase sigma factor RpoD/SigA [Candidatus Omnitrophota bacterium]
MAESSQGGNKLIKLYLKEINDIPLLEHEEVIKLARKAQRNNKKAMDQLIKSNLRLVVSIAKKYSYLGLPLLDLIEEGNLGLMKAVGKFDPKKGYRFSTYASWWIRQAIVRALPDQGKTIRIPVYMVEIVSQWNRVKDKLVQKLGRTPLTKEIAKEMKISLKKAKKIEELLPQPGSLNVPLDGEGRAEVIDLIEDEKSSSPFDEVSNIIRQERVSEIMNILSEKEREILSLRFGLNNNKTHTLEETAAKFSITRERVRQIMVIAMKKLKKNLV